MPDIAVLYHRGCRDGFASAAVADLYYRSGGRPLDEEVLYFGLDPGRLVSDLETVLQLPPETFIRSFDVGFSQEAYQLLKNHFHNFLIFDHHKTTAEAFPDGTPPEIHFDNDHCGCVLAWQYYYPNLKVPLFLLYLEERDLWRYTLPYSTTINEGLYGLITYQFDNGDFTKPVFTEWHQFMNNDDWYERALERGSIMVELKERDLAFAKRNARRLLFTCSVNGKMTDYTIMACNITSNISDLGNLLARENDCDFALLWRVVDTDVNVSLRSIGDFDTTVIAKAMNGGGHRNASGFTQPFSSLYLDSKKINFNRILEARVPKENSKA